MVLTAHLPLTVGGDCDRHLPGNKWGHPSSFCFESPLLDPYVSFKPSSKLKGIEGGVYPLAFISVEVLAC